MTDAAKHWTRVADAIHEHLGPSLDARRTKNVQDTFESFERELVPHLQPFIDSMLKNDAIPQQYRDLLETLKGPKQFAVAVLLGFALGSIVGPVVGAALQPDIQGIANNAWHAAAQDATAHVSGTIRPSAALLAEAVIKGVLDPTSAADLAAYNGITASDFQILTRAAGQSIGLEQALLLYRRGQIPLDGANSLLPGLKQVIQYSNINPEFYALPELLKYVPISVGEIVTANLKGHLADGDAVTMLQEAGVDGAKQVAPGVNTQQLLKMSAGRPPGIQEMLQLYHHSQAGLIATSVTLTDVEDAVKQSDINDHYFPFVEALGHYFPPPRSIVPMLRSEAITEAQATKLLKGYGIDDEWITAFLKESTKAAKSSVKELSAAATARGYEMGLIPKADALARIEAFGYNAADAELMLDIADAAKLHAFTAAAINRIRNHYIAHRTDRTTAQTDLQHLNLAPHVPAEYLAIWDEDRAANVPTLSNAQYQGALHRGRITLASFVLEMQNRGYTPTQIKILAEEAWPPTKTPPADVLALPG